MLSLQNNLLMLIVYLSLMVSEHTFWFFWFWACEREDIRCFPASWQMESQPFSAYHLHAVSGVFIETGWSIETVQSIQTVAQRL